MRLRRRLAELENAEQRLLVPAASAPTAIK